MILGYREYQYGGKLATFYLLVKLADQSVHQIGLPVTSRFEILQTLHNFGVDIKALKQQGTDYL